MAHPLILAIAGIAAGFAFLGGSIKSAFEQGNPAMWESEARAKALKKAQEDLQKAVDGVKTAEENLKKYAETWKKSDIMKFRKQYVIITDVKENLNYKEWRKECQ